MFKPQASFGASCKRTLEDSSIFKWVNVILLAIVLFIGEFQNIIQIENLDLDADCLF